MSTDRFWIKEHTLPACHVREYPRATVDDGDELHLAIKEYIPKEEKSSSAQGVTVIGAHANGFPKELYEPLWDELYPRLLAKGIYIQSIWIADVAHQGASGVLNEGKLGNDPSWLDHPRDLFLMINHFRLSMKRPLIGVGHSMGGNNLVNLASMHPRLFTTLLLMDPVVQRHANPSTSFNPPKASTARRDIWPSRAAAATKLKQSKFYQAWDPRVLDRWINYGLRDLPTALHPSTKPDPAHPGATPVTLTTTKHQEVLTFLRANFLTATHPDPSHHPNPLTHPDVDPASQPQSPFYAPATGATFAKLPALRPSVLYVFGDAALTDLSHPITVADKLATTGTGVGGSGGTKAGRVSSVRFEGVGHLIPMEVVGRTADAAAAWLGPEIERWRGMEDAGRRAWAAVPVAEKGRLSAEYVDRMLGNWAGEAKEKGDRGGKTKL